MHLLAQHLQRPRRPRHLHRRRLPLVLTLCCRAHMHRNPLLLPPPHPSSICSDQMTSRRQSLPPLHPPAHHSLRSQHRNLPPALRQLVRLPPQLLLPDPTSSISISKLPLHPLAVRRRPKPTSCLSSRTPLPLPTIPHQLRTRSLTTPPPPSEAGEEASPRPPLHSSTTRLKRSCRKRADGAACRWTKGLGAHRFSRSKLNLSSRTRMRGAACRPIPGLRPTARRTAVGSARRRHSQQRRMTKTLLPISGRSS